MAPDLMQFGVGFGAIFLFGFLLRFPLSLRRRGEFKGVRSGRRVWGQRDAKETEEVNPRVAEISRRRSGWIYRRERPVYPRNVDRQTVGHGVSLWYVPHQRDRVFHPRSVRHARPALRLERQLEAADCHRLRRSLYDLLDFRVRDLAARRGWLLAARPAQHPGKRDPGFWRRLYWSRGCTVDRTRACMSRRRLKNSLSLKRRGERGMRG